MHPPIDMVEWLANKIVDEFPRLKGKDGRGYVVSLLKNTRVPKFSKNTPLYSNPKVRFEGKKGPFHPRSAFFSLFWRHWRRFGCISVDS